MRDAPGIAARLSGRHVLLTGVTGFVGQALLHRLLVDVPDVSVTVLIRRKGSNSGRDRARSLLGKPIFADVRERAGDVDKLLEARVSVLEGDMGDVPALPADLDAVVHCAGDVSFNPPVDEAFTTNVVGTRDLLGRIEEIGSQVHYVHVSTAYVAGRRRGTVFEEPVDHDVDLEAELAWGLAQRDVVERESRNSDVLTKARTKAERDHGRAGLLTAAAATEERRREWVGEELIRLGTERARSLGWTDCYTFTKAMGERVVEAHAANAPVSIVRPSIIESALTTPHPGWIEGFKMAEPLILAYGRGELPEFPASPDTVIDIVPVDHVVAAIVAVLAQPPDAGSPNYLHVASSARNPLHFGQLYESVRAYYDAHPFTTGDRGAARLPDWRFPGAQAVERLLSTSERAHKVADYVIGRAPRSDRTRDLARKLDRQGRRLEFLRRYLDLYHEYTQTELRFADDNSMALYAGLSDDDRERFAFDTAVIDWHTYLADIHCPAVTQPLRKLDEARRKRKRDDATLAKLESSHDPDKPATQGVAAFFDMDGTMLSSNVIETYLWLRLREMSSSERAGHLGRIASRLPSLVRAERNDRGSFLRAIYREYAGARVADLDEVVDLVLTDHVLSRLAPGAVRRVREHRAAGHRTVLITGAIRPLTRPLAPLFDHIEAAELAVDDRGTCTGFLASSPLTGESRASWMRQWARGNGVDLAASYGYADSHSDLPLLAAVGRPVAVRPDVTLFRHARKNRWNIVDWASPDSVGRPLNPARAGR